MFGIDGKEESLQTLVTSQRGPKNGRKSLEKKQTKEKKIRIEGIFTDQKQRGREPSGC